MKRGVLLVIVLVVFLNLAIIGFCDVWWSGSPDFVLNETADFDTGFKSNSSSNYEIETYTDNLLISNNTFELGNRYSDRFTFPASSNIDNWKWNHKLFAGDTDFVKMNITDNKLLVNSTCNNCGNDRQWITLDSTITSGAFDYQIDFSHDQGNSGGMFGIGIMFSQMDNSPDDAGYSGFIINRNYSSYKSFDAQDNYLWIWTEVVTNASNGTLRINCSAAAVDSPIDLMLWNFTNADWQIWDSTARGWNGDVFLHIIADTVSGINLHNATLDDFKINTGELNNTPYRTSGNWTSETQTIAAGKKLKNTTINFTTSNSNYNITKVEWLTGGVVRASNETDITSSGKVNYSTSNGLSSGTFDDVITDFTIKIYLEGNGTGSPVIDDIIGNLEDSTGTTITWIGGTSTNWSDATNWDLLATPTGLDEVILNATPANQPVITQNVTVTNITLPASTILTVNATTNNQALWMKFNDSNVDANNRLGFPNKGSQDGSFVAIGNETAYITITTDSANPTYHWYPVMDNSAEMNLSWTECNEWRGSNTISWNQDVISWDNVVITEPSSNQYPFYFNGVGIYKFENVTSTVNNHYMYSTTFYDTITNCTIKKPVIRHTHLEAIDSCFDDFWAPYVTYPVSIISKDTCNVDNLYNIHIGLGYTLSSPKRKSTVTNDFTSSDYVILNVTGSGMEGVFEIDEDAEAYNFTIQSTSRGINVTGGSLFNVSNGVYPEGILHFDDGIGNFSINGSEVTFNAYKTNHTYVLTQPTRSGYNTIGHINVTNASTDSWVYMNFSYDDANVDNENFISIFRYDGSNWIEETGVSIDTTLNYVTVNLTTFNSPTLFGAFEKTNTTWHGNADTDWSNVNNWDNGVPDSGTVVYLNATPANQPVLTASSNALNLTIPASAILRTDGQNFQFENTTDVSGLLNISGGKFIFNGTDDGDCQLNVSSGGTLYIVDSANLTNGDTDDANYGLYIKSGSFFSANDSYIRKAGWQDIVGHRGVDIHTSNYANITNMSITGDYKGLHLYAAHFMVITNSKITAPSYGAYVYNSDYVTWVNNTITGSATHYGLYVYYYSTHHNITNNTLKGKYALMLTAYTNDHNVTGNNIDCTGNWYAIDLSDCEDSTFVDNNITSSVGSGAYVHGNSVRNNFTNNNITTIGANKGGMNFDASSDNCNITGGTWDLTNYALHVPCSGMIIKDVNVSSAGNGFWFSGASSYNNNISNSNITSTAYGVVTATAPYNNYIVNSTISGTTNDIYASGATAGNLTLENCSFDDADYLFGAGNTHEIYVKYYMNVYAFNISSTAVNGTNITITDVNSNNVFVNNATDANGYTGDKLVQAYMRNITGIFEDTPHTITSSAGTMFTLVYDSNSTTWNMTGNGTSTVPLFLQLRDLSEYTIYSAYPYQSDNYTRAFFGDNETVRIFANVSTLYQTNISIFDPDGTQIINNDNMTNYTESSNSALYDYDYNINGTIGYYNVTIGNTSFQNMFYRGHIWNYTDPADIANSTWRNSTEDAYAFRVELNLSEINGSTRHWEVIDRYIDFSRFGAHNSSIRVGMYNDSHIIEIPSQVYNQTLSNGLMNSSNVVFFSSLNQTGNRTYYVYYSRNDVGSMNYSTSLNTSNTSNAYVFDSKNYRVHVSNTYGGVIEEIYDRVGSDKSLKGYIPMQYSPDVTYTVPIVGSCAMVANTSPDVSYETGPIFTRYVLDSQAANCPYKVNYDMIYTFYDNAPYILVETNVTSGSSGVTWGSYIDHKLFLNGTQNKFINLTYRNAVDNIVYYPLTNGDGIERADLGDIKYIGMYNNSSNDGIADIFIYRNYSDVTTPDVDFYDDTNYEYYARTIASSFSAELGDFFYSKIGRMVFRATEESVEVNRTYWQLVAPINVSNSTHSTYDEEGPLNISIAYTPASPNSTTDIICYSNWTDNLDIDYAMIIENSTGANVSHTVTIDGTLTGEANYTISEENMTAINSSTAYVLCDVTAYDIAGNSNKTYVNIPVLDTRAPLVENISYDPNSSDQVDPYVELNITSNVTEYATIDTVIMQYRPNNTGAWTNNTMTYTSERNEANISISDFSTNSNYTVRVVANDTSGNTNISDSNNISVAYDTTWYVTPQDWGTSTATVGNIKSVVNLTINNTGDYDLNFTLSNNFNPDRTTYNITNYNNFNISAGNYTDVEVKFTAYETPSDNIVNISVTSNTTSQNDTIQRSSGIFRSSVTGVYLYLTVPVYSATVTAGEEFSLSGRMINLGDSTATRPWFKWTLPSGWNNTSDLNSSFVDLSPNFYVWNNQIIGVPTTATTGTYTITLDANCTEGENYTTSVEIALGTDTPDEPEETPPGPPGGGPGAGPGLTDLQSEKIFQTSELYEIVPGEIESFDMTVENPFLNSTMQNITLTVKGLLSQYIAVSPELINEININQSDNFTIKITAPSYFEKGEHQLEFIVRADVISLTTGRITDMTENRYITLAVHEISRTTALSLLDIAENLINEMLEAGFHAINAESLLESALGQFSERDYETVQELYSKIELDRNNAFESNEIIKQLEDELYRMAEYWGIDADKTMRILNLAKISFQRGEYSDAIDRVREAQLTFALETKGEYNIPFIIVNYWYYILLGLITLGIILYFTEKRFRLYMYNHKIKSLTKEEKILLGLMKQLQKDTFEKKKMSMGEYNNAMLEYSRRLNIVVKDIIKYETLKTHIYSIGGQKALLDERKKLLKMLRETQRKYLTKGKYDSRVYMNKMKAYSERLGEIQEQLSTLEAKRAMKKTRRSFLSKLKR